MNNAKYSDSQAISAVRKKILITKITSMGDLIQTLPAITDAVKAIPGLRFDWIAEESFQEIPRLHPSVDRIITLPYRRWKKNKWQALKSGEVSRFLQELRSEQYDMVIDAQSNLKSAFVSSLARGRKFGLDGQSVHEYGAHLAYHEKVRVNRKQNHANRLRQMMAALLDYELPKTQADYGINPAHLPSLDIHLPEKFVMAIPISSSSNKLWPEPYWHEVIQDVVNAGYEVVLPWWSDEEKARALRLKHNSPQIHLLPILTLSQKASVLSRATATISIDTGLAHMAAMLNIPNVCIYGSSDPSLCGTIGNKQIHLTANGPSCSPCSRAKCTYEAVSQNKPACLETIKPEQVLSSFYGLLA
ncbi:MAG: lipopolysaccharide heptosyltransferase I [Tatlockia sp.]|nr:lipopolysaccharide heptosyltransferase I [Tatlockia sp.]